MGRTTLLFGLIVIAAPTALMGQNGVDLEPGDSVRFVEVRTVNWQNDAGVVIRSTDERFPHSGRVLDIQGDSMRVHVDDRDTNFAIDGLADLQVQRVVADPRFRAFKRGGAMGAVVAGSAALAVALCNPSIFGGGGCNGPQNARQVTQFTLAGAAIGALALGSVAALLAPDSAWERVERFHAVMSPDGSAGLVLRVPTSW